jgi:hypothetical protein
MIIELLTQKGFVQNVDYSYENGELVALEQTRMIMQIDEDTQEEVQVEEAFYADLPSLAELKLEAVRQSDPALLISEYLKGKPVSDDDSLNVELFLNGQGGWRFAQVEAPNIDELFNLIQPVQEAQAIAQAKAQRIAQGRADRVKCEMALDLVAGYNRERSLTIEQITQMQSTFAQAEALLRANRPDFAAQVISAIEPDGVIITQEMKDDVLSVLQ